MSRLSTSVASHQLIFRFSAKTTKEEESSSLSAMGSRYAPSAVFWFSERASKPSSPSVSPATIKIASAKP